MYIMMQLQRSLKDLTMRKYKSKESLITENVAKKTKAPLPSYITR